MKIKKEKNASKKELLETAKSFESLSELRDAQIKKGAFLVAGIAVFLSICCVLAIVIILPLKSVEYKVIAVDTVTGRGDILTDIKAKEITEEEAVARFYSALYVKLREQYNYFSLQNDYDTVQLYSSGDVNNTYLALFDGDKSPDKVYSNAKNVASIQVISNSLTYGTAPDLMSMIRFKRTVRNIATNQTKEQFFIARLTFRFDLNKSMTEVEREVNPLGFTVTSYSVDEELR